MCILNFDAEPFRSWIAFHRQINLGSSCLRKENVDIDNLIISRNGDRKIRQPMRIASRPVTKVKKLNQFSQFK